MLRVRGTTRVLAVLGDPIAHTLSPEMHNAAIAVLGLNAVYVPLRVPPRALPHALETCAALGIAGNVTVPLKEAAAHAVASLSARARRVGAINTFWPEQGGLLGDNTDVAGLAEVVETLDAPAPWLVCGTGGSARAVAAVAVERRVRLLVRSRSAERAEAFCAWARTLDAAAEVHPDDGSTVRTAVNATPVGLDGGAAVPVPADRLAGTRVALDLVYRPGETAWVRACRARGLRALDGREPLLSQGALAFECFFPGQRAPREQMRAALLRALRE